MTFWFTVEDVYQDFRKVAHGNFVDSEQQFYSAEAASNDSVVDGKRMKLALFVDGTKLTKKVSQLNQMLVKDVFYQVLMVTLLASTFLIIMGVMRVKRLAVKMT